MKDQVKLGTQAADQLRKETKVLPDKDPRTQYVRRIGAALVATIPQKELREKPFRYSFDVIQHKEVNAFALPGGPCFVMTGLLERVTTEDQLAAILAHEITHARREHWARDYAKNQETSLGILVLGTLLNVNRDLMTAVSVADVLTAQLPRSRKYEYESDAQGFDIMLAAGYNPQGMVDVFKLLMAQPGDRSPEFISTHPDEKNRIKKLEERIAKLNFAFPPQRKIDPIARASSLRTTKVGKP